MKGLSKPISSPGRTDKFPPPLMRFLRSNAGSRSRGRSRSSPMFMRKKNSVAIETTQEPSSPKVTCIGQVRVKRSSKSSSAAAGGGGGISRSKSLRKTRRPSTSPKQQPCWWVKKLLFCRRISRKSRKRKLISSFFRKWAFFCGFGCRKIRDNTDSPPRVDPDPKAPTQEEETGCNSTSSGRGDGKAKPENKENTVGSSSSPPNYAFLLTRCRSAPYRSSSLACKFWGSPLNATEPETPETEPENLPQEEKPSSSPRKSQETEDSASSDDVKTKEQEEEEEKQETSKVEPIGKSAVHPLLLTRCKSEPARTGERLNPDAGHWKLRRFAEPHPSS